MDDLRFSIVIPCFNEASGLPQLIQEAGKIADQENGEFILVDNGSSDETLSILSIITHPRVRWISLPHNRGYGGGILRGLDETNSRFIGWTHADHQTPLQDVALAIAALELGNSFAKGRRRNRSIFDGIFTQGMGLFESLLFQTRLWDINAQPTMFDRSLMQSWVEPPSDFSLDLYALLTAKREKVGVVRVDVFFLSRKFGESSWNTSLRSRWRFIRRTINYSFKLRRRVQNAHHPS